MILREETLLKYGYDVNLLRPSSCKTVICECPQCHTQREKQFRDAHQLCKWCANKNRSEATKEFRSYKVKEHWAHHPHPRVGKTHTPEAREKIAAAHRGKPSPIKGKPGLSGSLNPFYGKKHKEESKRYGANNHSYGKTPTHTKKVWYECANGKSICFRSTWEAKVAKYLDEHELNWTYETDCIPVKYVVEGVIKESTYRPDFYLIDNQKYLEIKGRWYPGYKEKYEVAAQIIDVELWDRLKLKELGIL